MTHPLHAPSLREATPMYTMTLLSGTDRGALDDLLALRAGVGYWQDHLSGAAALSTLVTCTMPDSAFMAVGMRDEAALLAAFVVERAAPREGWTLDEREESSVLISRAYSHPEQPRLARFLTPWARDFAARLPDPPTAVRCTVDNAHLARYLIRTCGWRLVREVQARQGELHLLQHTPQRCPSVHELIRTSAELTACATGGTTGLAELP